MDTWLLSREKNKIPAKAGMTKHSKLHGFDPKEIKNAKRPHLHATFSIFIRNYLF